MADAVVVTDDGGETANDVATETVIDHAEDIGALKAETEHLRERVEGLETMIGGLAAQMDGMQDTIEVAIRAAFDAQGTAEVAVMEAAEAKEEAEEAKEEAEEVETPEEEPETPPAPPDEPPNSKKHPWWR